MFSRAVNQLLVVREMRDYFEEEHHQDDAGQQAAPFPDEGLLHRGGSLPEEYWAFFEEGRQFRVAGFLATSFDYATAFQFMCRADKRNEPCVAWEIRVDPRGKDQPWRRCMHVNYVQSSNVSAEKEYLFAPYSPFTVKQVSTRVCFSPSFTVKQVSARVFLPVFLPVLCAVFLACLPMHMRTPCMPCPRPAR